MDRKEFNDLLKMAEISKKEFAHMLDLTYGAVNNWGTNGKPPPRWAESWLKNYIKAKNFDDAKKIFCEEK